MEEKEILLKTIEGLNASIASLSTTNKNQSEQIKNLQERIKELTAQVAWLNRQLFGRKSEKLRVYDPNMPDLFADEFSGLRQQAEEKRDEAVEKIEKESVEDVKRNRQNRKMTTYMHQTVEQPHVGVGLEGCFITCKTVTLKISLEVILICQGFDDRSGP